MHRTDAIIIGGGQAGLAMSRSLQDRGIDHVVLERGRVAERWRSQRWDSLRLLTPNWQSRLPGYRYRGTDPDGYMTSGELVTYLEGYARSFSAPVHDETTVLSVSQRDDGYEVMTDQGTWRAPSVVVATGQCDLPHVPGSAKDLSPRVEQFTTHDYKRPGQLPEGGVLVVGGSATGVQLAEEIQQSGRQVTLAMGRHTRIPRRYRGRDIMCWLDAMGAIHRAIDDMRDPEAARHEPSLQLVGRPDGRSIDIGTLRAIGVNVVGRFAGAEGARARFQDNLAFHMAHADERLSRLLDRVDAHAARRGIALDGPAERPRPLTTGPTPTELDLENAGIRSVVWATGFRREYPWLQVPVLDPCGDIRHDVGVTNAPGLYVLGLSFLSHRDSSFIDGVGRDARRLAGYVEAHLAGTTRSVA